MSEFNKKGDKVTFYGVPEFYYPMFINIGEQANKYLEVGKEYTVAKCEVYSSWSAVWLEELPDYYFNASFFKKQDGGKPISELIKNERD